MLSVRAGVLLAFLSGVQASDLCTGLGEYAKGSCNCDAGFKGERCDQLYVVDVFTFESCCLHRGERDARGMPIC